MLMLPGLGLSSNPSPQTYTGPGVIVSASLLLQVALVRKVSCKQALLVGNTIFELIIELHGPLLGRHPNSKSLDPGSPGPAFVYVYDKAHISDIKAGCMQAQTHMAAYMTWCPRFVDRCCSDSKHKIELGCPVELPTSISTKQTQHC